MKFINRIKTGTMKTTSNTTMNKKHTQQIAGYKSNLTKKVNAAVAAGRPQSEIDDIRRIGSERIAAKIEEFSRNERHLRQVEAGRKAWRTRRGETADELPQEKTAAGKKASSRKTPTDQPAEKTIIARPRQPRHFSKPVKTSVRVCNAGPAKRRGRK